MQTNERIEALRGTEMSSAVSHLYRCYKHSMAANHSFLLVENYQGSPEEFEQAVLDMEVKKFAFRGTCTNDCELISHLLFCGFKVLPNMIRTDYDEIRKGLFFYHS